MLHETSDLTVGLGLSFFPDYSTEEMNLNDVCLSAKRNAFISLETHKIHLLENFPCLKQTFILIHLRVFLRKVSAYFLCKFYRSSFGLRLLK